MLISIFIILRTFRIIRIKTKKTKCILSKLVNRVNAYLYFSLFLVSLSQLLRKLSIPTEVLQFFTSISATGAKYLFTIQNVMTDTKIIKTHRRKTNTFLALLHFTFQYSQSIHIPIGIFVLTFKSDIILFCLFFFFVVLARDLSRPRPTHHYII